jgi:hypothetical protein
MSIKRRWDGGDLLIASKRRRVKRRAVGTRTMAFRSMRVARALARRAEVKTFYATFAGALTTANTPVGPNGLLLNPIAGIAQGPAVTQRIGERIKVKRLTVRCRVQATSDNQTLNIDGAAYQFVIFQEITPPSVDGNSTGSIPGRYWDVNSAGQPVTDSLVDVWAFKARDSRYYSTKTLVRKIGVIKPASIVSQSSGAVTGGAGIMHMIFSGSVKLAKPVITFRGDNTVLNEVFCILVCNKSHASGTAVVCTSELKFTDT